MGDGSMMTLTIADPEKKGISEYLKSLPSRNPVGCPGGPIPGIGSGYMQNGVEYPSPYDYSIYTDYLKALQLCIPPAPKNNEQWIKIKSKSNTHFQDIFNFCNWDPYSIIG